MLIGGGGLERELTEGHGHFARDSNVENVSLD